MSQYDVKPEFGPVCVSTNVAEKTTIYNVGTSTVYVTATPTTTGGFPLNAGDSLSWDPGSALYVYSTVAGKVYVSAEGHEYTSAQAIASQIMTAGLADSIAERIQVRGAPPIDKLTSLATTTFPPPFTGNPSILISVAEWQSVVVRISEDVSAAGTVPTKHRTVILSWRDDADFLTLYSETFLLSDANNNPLGGFAFYNTFTASVKSPKLRITILDDGPPLSTGVGLVVFGSYKSQEQSRYMCISAYPNAGLATVVGNGTDMMQSALITNKVAGQIVTYLHTRSGPASVHIYAGNVTTGGRIFVYDASDGFTILATSVIPVGAGPFVEKFDLIVPYRPLRFIFDASIVATTLRASIVYT